MPLLSTPTPAKGDPSRLPPEKNVLVRLAVSANGLTADAPASFAAVLAADAATITAKTKPQTPPLDADTQDTEQNPNGVEDQGAAKESADARPAFAPNVESKAAPALPPDTKTPNAPTPERSDRDSTGHQNGASPARNDLWQVAVLPQNPVPVPPLTGGAKGTGNGSAPIALGKPPATIPHETGKAQSNTSDALEPMPKSTQPAQEGASFQTRLVAEFAPPRRVFDSKLVAEHARPGLPEKTNLVPQPEGPTPHNGAKELQPDIGKVANSLAAEQIANKPQQPLAAIQEQKVTIATNTQIADTENRWADTGAADKAPRMLSPLAAEPPLKGNAPGIKPTAPDGVAQQPTAANPSFGAGQAEAGAVRLATPTSPPVTPNRIAPVIPWHPITVTAPEDSFAKDLLALDPISGEPRLSATPTQAATATAHPRAELPSHVARQLAEALQHNPNRPVEITLKPQELGAVRLSVHQAETGIIVSLTAERPETLDLMRRHIDQLGQEFKAMGYADIAFSFAGSDAGTDGDPDGSSAPASDALDDPPDVPATQIHLASDTTGGVDIRL